MATVNGTAPSSQTVPAANNNPTTPTASSPTAASFTTAPPSPHAATSPATPITATSPMNTAEGQQQAVAPEVKKEAAAAAASTSAAHAAAAEVPAASTAAPAAATEANAAGKSTAVPAAAASKDAQKDTVAAEPKASSGSRASDEKGTTSSTTPPSAQAKTTSTPPTNKKRRKRGGLASIFVALGCMSADEFDDAPPSKGAPPPGAANKGGAVKPAAVNTTATPAKSTGPSGSADEPVKTAPATKSSNNTSSAAKTGAAVAAGAGAAAAAGAGVAAAGSEGDRAGASNANAPDQTSEPAEALVYTQEPGTTPPLEETAGLTSGAVQAPGSGADIIHQHQLHRSESEHHLAAHGADGEKAESSGGFTDLSESDGMDEGGHHEMLYGDDEFEDDEDRLISQGGIGIPVDEHGNPAPLLPELSGIDTNRKCLVLDLDETLLHSSFKMLPSADYIVPVEIESQTHNVYVIKRPGVDHFLTEMGKLYEIVVFTASLSKYADPVLDMLDVGRVVRHRLFRESCYNHKGNYVKDLSQLGRDIDKTIIIDNSPASYIFHPNNAVPVSTWFNDPHDTELTDLCPFLTDLAAVDDVRGVLDGSI